MKITHSKPTLSKKEIKAVTAVLKSGHIARGKKVEEFERKFARFLSVSNAVAVNSGSSALHMALVALGVGRGHEVIIPSYACSALVNAILYVGAKPVVADVNSDDLNISFDAVKKLKSRKTKAIIVVHGFGLAADIILLKKLGIPIIEDCAHALGATYKGKRVGSLADISVFSFYATKMLTTVEGGMVASNNTKYIRIIRDLIDYDERVDHKLRFNYKMSDVQAAMGIAQLSQLSGFIRKRRNIARLYGRLLRDLPCTLPGDRPERKHIYFRYILRFDRKNTCTSVMRALNKRGIECKRPVFKPLYAPGQARRYPVTEHLMQTSLSIPIYPGLSAKDVRLIAQKIRRHAK